MVVVVVEDHQLENVRQSVRVCVTGGWYIRPPVSLSLPLYFPGSFVMSGWSQRSAWRIREAGTSHIRLESACPASSQTALSRRWRRGGWRSWSSATTIRGPSVVRRRSWWAGRSVSSARRRGGRRWGGPVWRWSRGGRLQYVSQQGGEAGDLSQLLPYHHQHHHHSQPPPPGEDLQ